jgi:hypothetical protein
MRVSVNGTGMLPASSFAYPVAILSQVKTISIASEQVLIWMNSEFVATETRK